MTRIPATTSIVLAPAAPVRLDGTQAAISPIDTALAQVQPLDPSNATAVLSSGGGYVRSAESTLSKLDEGLEQRESELAELERRDPQAHDLDDQRSEVDMLYRLRDRIQLSIDRVTDILAGVASTEIDITGSDLRDMYGIATTAPLDHTSQRREDLDLLQQRHGLLAPAAPPIGQAPGVAQVMRTYDTSTYRFPSDA